MIFTGFTDQKGSTIPVQGAGTVYDENKNAIKHGYGLVSDGHNQVVHGRYNAADASMEEIVGGGYGPNSYKFVVKPYLKGSDESFPTPPGQYTNAIKQPFEFVAERIATYLQKEWYLVVEVTKQCDVTMRDLPSSYQPYGNEWPDEIKVGHCICIYNTGSVDYPTGTQVLPYNYIDGVLYRHDGVKVTDSNIIDPHNQVPDGFVYNWLYAVSKTEVTSSTGNIRTLDWLGNETIKGTLTAGKDVVCKDALGNPVSLLYLNDDLGRITSTILVELDTSGGTITAYHEGDSFDAIFAESLLNKTFKVRVRLHNLDVDEYIIVDAYRYNDGNKKVVDIYCGNRIIRIVTNQDNSIDIDVIELDNIFSTNS